MSDPVILVENLSKRFIIGHEKQEQYTTMRDVIAGNVKGAFRRTREIVSGNIIKEGSEEEEFWALKDVNFSIRQGDRVGLIGRNGAGKSTLLKILSRITEPTHGKITIRGRVASLLEVGTGFHPELSGRENIFLNGAILGMSRAEIRKKFDEIVAFAEVERFLDTPVKRYSSGMYVRLAFSVAAHLEPEILIVDEVLAVGDAQFQKKCLGKMEDVSNKEGRTVLFVSHNLGAVQRLCNTAILMSQGKMSFTGTVNEAVRLYMQNLNSSVNNVDLQKMPRSGNQHVVVKDVQYCDEHGESAASIRSGDTLKIKFVLENTTDTIQSGVSVGISFHNDSGDVLVIQYSDYSTTVFDMAPGLNYVEASIEKFPFPSGRYYTGVRILINGSEADWPREMVGFIDVHGENYYASNQTYHSGIGPFLINANWRLNK